MPIFESVKTTAAGAPDLALTIAPIAHAVESGSVPELAMVLERLGKAGAFAPTLFLPPQPGRYGRRLLYRDPQSRFVVVAMTWGPGQFSPLHDHAGLWGAEIVTQGTMRETMFELRGCSQDGRYDFARGVQRRCTAGTVATVVPPLEHHEFGNAGDGVAQSLHVYGGDLRASQAFAQDGSGRWRARSVELHYDAE